MYSETGPDTGKPLVSKYSPIGKLALFAVFAIVVWIVAVADYLPIWDK